MKTEEVAAQEGALEVVVKKEEVPEEAALGAVALEGQEVVVILKACQLSIQTHKVKMSLTN